jgi:hypothetical protein
MRHRRRWPAPAPTPEGMVWRTDNYGFTRLVPEAEAQQNSKRIMAAFDSQPLWLRKRERGDDPRLTS